MQTCFLFDEQIHKKVYEFYFFHNTFSCNLFYSLDKYWYWNVVYPKVQDVLDKLVQVKILYVFPLLIITGPKISSGLSYIGNFLEKLAHMSSSSTLGRNVI